MKRVVLLILVLAILVAGVWFVRRADRTDTENMRELYTQVEPLQRQKEALQAEKKALESEYEVLMRDPSTVEILFREIDENLYTKVYPLMRDRGITGVIGLNAEKYPGKYGQITKEQYIRLLKDGWGGCLVFERGYTLSNWLEYLEVLFEADELVMPKVIYFPENTYDPEMESVLREKEIKTVLLSAENGRTATISQIGDIWFADAMPWNYTGINSDIELLSYTDSRNLCFTVSFNDMWDAYEEASFVKLLNTLEEVLMTENLLENEAIVTPMPSPADQLGEPEAAIEQLIYVTSFEEARRAHQEAIESHAVYERERVAQEASLDSQIEQLTEQINAIYSEWSKKTGVSMSEILG